MAWDCDALYDLEEVSEVECRTCELLGVVGPPFKVLDERAVSGVGALISDFLGVSMTCFDLLPLRLEDDGADLELIVRGFCRRPAVTKGCRIAA